MWLVFHSVGYILLLLHLFRPVDLIHHIRITFVEQSCVLHHLKYLLNKLPVGNNKEVEYIECCVLGHNWVYVLSFPLQILSLYPSLIYDVMYISCFLENKQKVTKPDLQCFPLGRWPKQSSYKCGISDKQLCYIVDKSKNVPVIVSSGEEVSPD